MKNGINGNAQSLIWIYIPVWIDLKILKFTDLTEEDSNLHSSMDRFEGWADIEEENNLAHLHSSMDRFEVA